jgi:rifampin ADP-ribosylating transferase
MSDKNQTSPSFFKQTYFHGTKADLKLGDLVGTGVQTNYQQNRKLKHVYMSATLDAAIWGAELALGDAPERIYLVEPTGEIEDDPNLTDKKFPGNPTLSYRSEHPFRVVGEITVWQGHPPEQVKARKDARAKIMEQGSSLIED